MTQDLAGQLRSLDYLLPEILLDVKNLKIETRPSVDASQDNLEEFFPYTLGRPHITLKKGTLQNQVSPLRVGVVFSGGPAPGGHNVIVGLFEGLKQLHPDSRLFGFLNGPSGIINEKYIEITEKECLEVRNQGGFDLIGSGRTKIETPEQLSASLKTAKHLHLDGLIVVGGDDSNTNAALLAEFFVEHACETCVIGVPKTIDGDLQNPDVEISFGFHTACSVYAEMIGNLARDARSAKKYTHFIKLMGRSASHIALECAIACHPNCTLIGEEIRAENKTLAQIVAELADLVMRRSEIGKNYSVIVVPEGLIEFIPEMGSLIGEISALKEPPSGLSSEALHCFNLLPESIQKQILFERDPHGNVPLSFIETEKLLSSMVDKELKRRGFQEPFYPVHHFFGYEGRCAFPTPFDARYCTALGKVAAALVSQRCSGYMCYVKGLTQPLSAWEIGGIPLTSLIHLEMRKGKKKPVIAKALVDLKAPAFAAFSRARGGWTLEDNYLYPGPIQFFGDEDLVYKAPYILCVH